MVNFKANNIPLYLQIKDHIKKYIEDGNLPIGHRLPSERELAEEIGVSRKTVSLAYEELEKEGILSSHRGRGTFVIKMPTSDKTNYESIMQVIDECLNSCLKKGVDPDAFLSLCSQRVKEYKQKLHKLKIMIVECNKEQLDYFCKELELGAGVTITPVLLQDFKKDFANIPQKLKDYDFLITTLFHIDEVRQIISNQKINILPIALHPQLESIIKIARVPKQSSIGILTISENFANKVERVIFEAGLNFKSIIKSTATKPSEIIRFLEQVDTVIVSPGRKKHVTPYLKNNQNIIEFIFVPDAGSINLLNTSITKDKSKLG
ncbi:winged helix-turn-helix transcriptional regulator [Tepidanaerobacter sp. GT38]|uniref:GntR family transcriptional regulator n=1 Tax=Tepidanaerobacter sp. GT38 TaxID=2722793 RepID=UPI001F219516|nr:winged helix-turn-helix domain-containing protein [Tepidanaerobacter sp. GT38]MCG1011793.1 winged helix-turn-helix transcriptional regulator [Tepidanaerobacter sp. GT38]